MRSLSPRGVLLLLAALSALPVVSAPVALLAGVGFGLATGNPLQAQTSAWSKRLLQLSVVGLGFGVDLPTVLHTGRAAVGYTAISIAGTMLAGEALRRVFQTPARLTTLLSFGTAICGGSAIAAMAPVLEAEPEETGVSLATIFLLNAAGLLIFPPLGHALGMSEAQFGVWAALALHDTSSVVGAASAFGASALAIGTTVKLTRALWILPSALVAALVRRAASGAGRTARPPFPWFVLGFLATAALRSLWPSAGLVWELLARGAKQALVVTLLLIGAGLTRRVLAQAGARPLLLALTLWLLVASVSAAAILAGWIP